MNARARDQLNKLGQLLDQAHAVAQDLFDDDGDRYGNTDDEIEDLAELIDAHLVTRIIVERLRAEVDAAEQLQWEKASGAFAGSDPDQIPR